MFEYKKDDKRRREILGLKEENKYKNGGIDTIENVPVDIVQKLIDEKFVNPDEYQNDSPTTQEFLIFLKTHEGFTLSGYIVSPDRNDYRITFTSISGETEDADTISDFIDNFRMADEFDVNIDYRSYYAW